MSFSTKSVYFENNCFYEGVYRRAVFIREKAFKRSNTVDIEVNILIFIHFLKSLLAC